MTLIASLPVITSTVPGDIIPIVDTTNQSQSAAGTTSQITVGNLIPAQWYAGYFGNGSDGAVTLDGTATFGFASKAGSTYTLTRDVFATSLTVNSGVTLLPGPFRIFCTGTVTNNGTISANGNAGLAAGTAGAASSASSGVLGVGAAGGAGNTAAGSGGGRGTNAVGLGVNQGGAGGAGSSGAGGSQGFAGSNLTSFLTPAMFLSGMGAYGTLIGQMSGGGSGGGGGGDGTNHGGGGGGAAGIVCIFAHAVINNGTITAVGGNGGTPATGNCGGGGAGAGGLIIAFTLSAWTAGTTTVTGGTAGSGVGTGTAGSNGSVGNAVNLVLA